VIVLVLWHLFIMHYQHAPSATGTAFVGRRWVFVGWRAFDWALLVLALTHGLVGTHGAIRAAVRSSSARSALDAAFVAGGCAFLGLGTLSVIVAPTAAHSGPGPLSSQTWIPATLTTGLVAIATLAYLAWLGLAATLLWRLWRRTPIGWWNYPGQWAFALNRTAGIGVLAFLLAHIADVALYPLAPDLYDRTVAGYAMPYLIPMEVALVAAVVYHALNGLRLIALEAMDRRAGAARTPSFLAVVLATALIVLPAIAIMLRARP
jgi:succinate dehydrogenase / fumarate reductase cytochrome b subunit